MPELAEVRFKENYRVTVHRRFAEAIFDTPLSIYEQRIFYAALSNIEPPIYKKDENNKLVLDENGKKIITNYISEFPVFEMRLKEFGELVGLKEIDYRHIKRIMRDFKKKGLEIHRIDRPEHEIDARDYRGINILLESEYLHKEGKIRLEFSPKLLPYVANLTGEFITVPLNVITSFTSKYSTKLYLLMQQWKMVKQKEFEIDELKEIMGVPFDIEYRAGKPIKSFKLELYANFKKRALEPAINEINKYSNLSVQIVEVKKGRKIGKIRFNIGQSTTSSITQQPSGVGQTESSYSLQEYLAKEVFDDLGFGKMFFKNVAKSLVEIPNLDSDRELEHKVYLGLTDLKLYVRSQNNLGEGFLISKIREMVKFYNDNGVFQLENDYTRTELHPDWFNEKNSEDVKKERLEFEQKQPFKVIRKEALVQPREDNPEASEMPSEDAESNQADMEAIKQEMLKKLADRKAKK
ncbi:replication initiation protein (plasmid) [Planococcus maritimus]|uniref:replication initiation protein n=1 Tax=Planococcus maritimus TaxID=192421 RepID=UPI0031392D77